MYTPTPDAHVGKDNLLAELVESVGRRKHLAVAAHLDDDREEAKRTRDELGVRGKCRTTMALTTSSRVPALTVVSICQTPLTKLPSWGKTSEYFWANSSAISQIEARIFWRGPGLSSSSCRSAPEGYHCHSRLP